MGRMNHSKAATNPWMFIEPFSLELMVEKVISSAAPMPLSPGDALRRIFESIAGKRINIIIYILDIYKVCDGHFIYNFAAISFYLK